ncbi:MAG: 1-deoxy-D-xylulose-5-phosphate reductoisomerase [Bacillota bacterium]
MKNVVILGSTGSIGTQTLDVINSLSGYNVLAISAHSSIDLFARQVKKFHPTYALLAEDDMAQKLKDRLANKTYLPEILGGKKDLEFLAALPEADIVVNALVGAVGLKPSLACLDAENQLALANKESMVIGGELINQKLRETGQQILPIDSEHNAVFQVLCGHNDEQVKKIYLTASGGPFWDFSVEEIKNVTVQQALNHPNWDMGPKITIDSATMMNKGLEVIEAHYLFDQPFDKIQVVIHPESIIHSLVEFKDNSIQAELGAADMRIPIQNVLTYPETKAGVGRELDLFAVGTLNFQAPDFEKFPGLKLAYRAGRSGGTMPAVLNAANEIAVQAFLEKKITFYDISDIIEIVLNKHEITSNPGLDDILRSDGWAREAAEEVIEDVIYDN